MPRWSVLLTTHDRAATTRRCLEALAAQDGHDLELEVVVCDAGSRDGTPEVVLEAWPTATVLRRDDSLFWSAGMREAWAEVIDRPDLDGHLWLNDDTVLDPDALARLRATQADLDEADRTIVVGATRAPDDPGRITYSGVDRPEPRRRPLAWDKVTPDPHRPREVETMNGNCVLVPRAVAADVGNLDAAFTHGMADYDYGLRARARGHHVLLAPGTVGTCAPNPLVQRTSLGEQWRALRSPKGLAADEWVTFARRWAGPLWPLFAASPWVRRLARAGRRQLAGRAGSGRAGDGS